MSQCDENRGWENYFSSLPSSTPGKIEAESHMEKLASEGKRIFSGQGDIEMWQKNAGNVAIKSTLNTDNIDTTKDAIYFIKQQTSWSALQVSAEAVQRLLTAYSVSPVFLEALYSFGRKVTGDDDPYFSLCEERPTLSPSVRELCYVLRTYERHGRHQLNDPWSLRQSLIYQRHDHETNKSVWIFVQLFQGCRKGLWKEFIQTHTWHLMRPHYLFLEVILPDWRWYFDYQRRFIREFTEKAMHSSLAQRNVDYEVDFVDCQRIERALEKLFISLEVLTQIEHIACTLQSSVDRSKSLRDHASDCVVRDSHEISLHINKIQGFQKTALALQNRAERASVLLTKLLDYRRMDLLDTNTKALAQLGTEAGSQRKNLKTILEETQADSKRTKAMTFVATIHLPANLLAAIFSSDLVYVPPNATDSKAVVLSVRNAMGVYVALSLVLTGVMVTASSLWSRRSPKSARIP